MRRVHAAVTLACALHLTLAGAGCRDHNSTAAPSAAESADGARREAALRRARVWTEPDTEPGDADFARNPSGADAFDANADVECDFSIEPVGGTTPKFNCALPSGEHIKVKYGAPNGELPAEVAGTRLLTALGFPTDRMFRVRSVRCRGCPPFPHQALGCLARAEPAALCLQGASPTSVVTFSPAVIERPIAGKKIEAPEGGGWAWFELDRIDPAAGGSPRAHVDALRVMAVLLAHWDNKAANQKLICPPGEGRADGSCRAPVAAIGDLGATFGPTRIDLAHWQAVPIWADARACRVSMAALPYGGATFPDTQISEAGRQFLLRRLRALTREQLETLFTASGITAFPHVLAAARQPGPWADAFLDKVSQIETAGPCPN